MTDTILGLLGFLLGLGCFLAGFRLREHRPRPAKEPMQSRESEHMEEEMAFRALTGYSADIAYGLAEFPEETEL